MKTVKHVYLLFRILGLYVTAPLVFIALFMALISKDWVGVAIYGVLSGLWIKAAHFRYHVKYGWI